MRITWKGTTYGPVGFHAELQEYDSTPPVQSLLLDHAPSSINPEREAVAAYLAFGRWASGDLLLPHKLGPNTAAAIESDLELVSLRPGPIEYYPKPLELGVREVHVHFSAQGVERNLPNICVLPSSEWNGSLRGLRSVAVSSNAFVLDGANQAGVAGIRARLAVAVLFSGDLSADSLIVHCEQEMPESERESISALLLACRLGATFV